MHFPSFSLPFYPSNSSFFSYCTRQRHDFSDILAECFDAPFVFCLVLAVLIVTLRWYITRHPERRNRGGGRGNSGLPRWEPEAKGSIDGKATFKQHAPSTRFHDRAQKAVWWADPVRESEKAGSGCKRRVSGVDLSLDAYNR
jgi:hypothetical protein